LAFVFLIMVRTTTKRGLFGGFFSENAGGWIPLCYLLYSTSFLLQHLVVLFVFIITFYVYKWSTNIPSWILCFCRWLY
jgi:hypothetical protein